MLSHPAKLALLASFCDTFAQKCNGATLKKLAFAKQEKMYFLTLKRFAAADIYGKHNVQLKIEMIE